MVSLTIFWSLDSEFAESEKGSDTEEVIEVKSLYTWDYSLHCNLYEKINAIEGEYSGEVWIIRTEYPAKTLKLLFIQRVVDDELQFVNSSLLGITTPCKIICDK